MRLPQTLSANYLLLLTSKLLKRLLAQRRLKGKWKKKTTREGGKNHRTGQRWKMGKKGRGGKVAGDESTKALQEVLIVFLRE